MRMWFNDHESDTLCTEPPSLKKPFVFGVIRYGIILKVIFFMFYLNQLSLTLWPKESRKIQTRIFFDPKVRLFLSAETKLNVFFSLFVRKVSYFSLKIEITLF